MKNSSRRALFYSFLAVAVLFVISLGFNQMALGNAIQDRLLGDRLKPISPEEVSAVVEKHPDDAQLLYAASDYFSGTERGPALLARAVGLDKRYEVVAFAQELYRDLSTRPVPDASEALSRLVALDPENALPHWFLAYFAFVGNDAQEGFAQIDEALKEPKFDTYGLAHLQARFRLLDALGRDGMLKFSVAAAVSIPETSYGRLLAKKLIERGDQKLADGDGGGALADHDAADRLANQLLLARPGFAIREIVAVTMKQMAGRARLKLYEAKGDAASAAGARLQLRALRDHLNQYAITAERFPVCEVMRLEEWPALSEETLQAHLAQSKHFAAALDTAAEQVNRYLSLPEYDQMMDLLFDTLFTQGGLASREKAIEFYEQSSLPREQERLMQAVGALREVLKRFPERKHSACVGNLKCLGLAIAIYANDHEALPGSLAVLAAGGYIDHPAILKCPVSGTEYVYSGKGLTFAADPNTITAYDGAPVHHARGGRYLLCLDGHVELVPEEAFQERLRQQQQSD